MTEKEKMLQGLMYNARDNELVSERAVSKKICQKYNVLPDDKIKKKEALLKKLFNRNTKCHVQAPFSCDYGYNIEFGTHFYANYNCVIIDANKVSIGDDVMFGPGVHIYTVNHPEDIESRKMGLEYASPVTIGNRVWVGGHATICPGVTIGDNAVIGAGSVVTESIPPYAVAVGNPCKVIKIVEHE